MTSINMQSRSHRLGISTAGTGALILLWYVVTELVPLFPAVALPSPITVVNRVIDTSNIILDNLWPTLLSSLFGFVVAVVLGIGVAIILASKDWMREALMPLIVSGNSVPRVSLAPVIIFYIGGFQAKYMIAAWVAFFPMLVNALEGLSSLDDDMELLLESLDANLWQEFRKVRFPNSLPFLFDGMKISVTLAIVGAVVGEFVGAEEGMGWLALFALQSLDIPLVFGIVGAMGFVSVSAFYILFKLQDHLVHWQESALFAE